MRIVVSGILLLACFSGCRSLADELRGSVQARNGAEMSWRHSRDIYSNLADNGAFADGYKAGFISASKGSGPVGQPTPPTRLQTQASRGGWEQQQAWYDGYSHGVLAAQHEYSQHHATLDTTVVREGEIRDDETIVIHEGGPPSGELPMRMKATESSPQSTAAPSHLPPTGLGSGTAITIEESQQPVESQHPVPSEPSFVPPPPAPPMEETRTGRQNSTQKVSHSTRSNKDAAAVTTPATAPALSLSGAPVESSQAPATPVAPQIPKKNRAEWQMPVLNAKAVWGL